MIKETNRMKSLKKEVLEEIKHLRETGVPRCSICKKPMKNAYDSKLKKISPYLWETTCEHNKGMRLSIG